MDKLLLLIEYILKKIGDHLCGIVNITVEELINSAEYNAFKEMLKKTLTFNVKIAIVKLSDYNQHDATQSYAIGT